MEAHMNFYYNIQMGVCAEENWVSIFLWKMKIARTKRKHSRVFALVGNFMVGSIAKFPTQSRNLSVSIMGCGNTSHFCPGIRARNVARAVYITSLQFYYVRTYVRIPRVDTSVHGVDGAPSMRGGHMSVWQLQSCCPPGVDKCVSAANTSWVPVQEIQMSMSCKPLGLHNKFTKLCKLHKIF